MKSRNILRIAAFAAVAIAALSVLIYGLATGFGFGDFARTIDNGVYSAVPYTYEEETDTLHGLEIHWESGPVNVRIYDGDTIRVTETGREALSTEERLTMEMSGGALVIRWNGSFWSFATLRSAPKRLEVEIPQALAGNLDTVRIQSASGKIEMASFSMSTGVFETASGDIALSGITADTLEIKTASGTIEGGTLTAETSIFAESVSGEIELKQLKAPKLSLDTTSGAVSAAVTADKITCSSVSGNVALETAAWAKSCKVSTVSGAVRITAPEANEGFTCAFSTVSGGFDSAFDTAKSGKNYVNGSGGAKLEISTTSGNARIEKAE